MSSSLKFTINFYSNGELVKREVTDYFVKDEEALVGYIEDGQEKFVRVSQTLDAINQQKADLARQLAQLQHELAAIDDALGSNLWFLNKRLDLIKTLIAPVETIDYRKKPRRRLKNKTASFKEDFKLYLSEVNGAFSTNDICEHIPEAKDPGIRKHLYSELAFYRREELIKQAYCDGRLVNYIVTEKGKEYFRSNNEEVS